MKLVGTNHTTYVHQITPTKFRPPTQEKGESGYYFEYQVFHGSLCGVWNTKKQCADLGVKVSLEGNADKMATYMVNCAHVILY